jgi:hypothetical protein
MSENAQACLFYGALIPRAALEPQQLEEFEAAVDAAGFEIVFISYSSRMTIGVAGVSVKTDPWGETAKLMALPAAPAESRQRELVELLRGIGQGEAWVGWHLSAKM